MDLEIFCTKNFIFQRKFSSGGWGIHSLNDCKCWGWARQKPGIPKLNQICPIWVAGTQPCESFPLSPKWHISRNLELEEVGLPPKYSYQIWEASGSTDRTGAQMQIRQHHLTKGSKVGNSLMVVQENTAVLRNTGLKVQDEYNLSWNNSENKKYVRTCKYRWMIDQVNLKSNDKLAICLYSILLTLL